MKPEIFEVTAAGPHFNPTNAFLFRREGPADRYDYFKLCARGIMLWFADDRPLDYFRRVRILQLSASASEFPGSRLVHLERNSSRLNVGGHFFIQQDHRCPFVLMVRSSMVVERLFPGAPSIYVKITEADYDVPVSFQLP